MFVVFRLCEEVADLATDEAISGSVRDAEIATAAEGGLAKTGLYMSIITI